MDEVADLMSTAWDQVGGEGTGLQAVCHSPIRSLANSSFYLLPCKVEDPGCLTSWTRIRSFLSCSGPIINSNFLHYIDRLLENTNLLDGKVIYEYSVNKIK